MFAVHVDQTEIRAFAVNYQAWIVEHHREHFLGDFNRRYRGDSKHTAVVSAVRSNRIVVIDMRVRIGCEWPSGVLVVECRKVCDFLVCMIVEIAFGPVNRKAHTRIKAAKSAGCHVIGTCIDDDLSTAILELRVMGKHAVEHTVFHVEERLVRGRIHFLRKLSQVASDAFNAIVVHIIDVYRIYLDRHDDSLGGMSLEEFLAP